MEKRLKGFFKLEDYMERFLDACGVSVQIKDTVTDSQGVTYYDCALVYDNKELLLKSSSSYSINASITTEDGQEKILVKMNRDNCYFYGEDALNGAYNNDMVWIKDSRSVNFVVDSNHQSYYLMMTYNFGLNAYFSRLDNDEKDIKLPSIAINIRELSLDEYLNILKSQIMNQIKGNLEDEKWIDLMLADSRLRDYVQKSLDSIPHTFEEAEKKNNDKRARRIAEAKAKRDEKIAQANAEFEIECSSAEKAYQEYDNFLIYWRIVLEGTLAKRDNQQEENNSTCTK